MASNQFRMEHDFFGDREVPADAYYGIQTVRGKENFHITGMPISWEPYFVKAVRVCLKPALGYRQCAELAREGYETGKSLHDIVVKERKLLTQQRWNEIFSFENLIHPKFEQ